MGVKFAPPKVQLEELEGLSIAQTSAGFPTSAIREDSEWNSFVQEDDYLSENVMKKEIHWTLTGGQVPTAFNEAALRKQLSRYRTIAGYARNTDAFEQATGMLTDCLVSEIGPIRELSRHEAVFGSDDGRLAMIPFGTSNGLGLSKLSGDLFGLVENHLDWFLYLIDEDDRRVRDASAAMWVWPTKTSLKDARLPVEKVATSEAQPVGKARVFNGASKITSINGRRYIGDFIGKFMERCAKGGFIGIVSLVLARGGWHDLMKDLTDNFTREKIYDFDIKWFDKDFIREFHFRVLLAIAMLAGKQHARNIMRHYERVAFSPTVITIFGILFYCARGMPSGDIATVIINTLAQLLVYMYLYCKSIPESMPELLTYNEFKNNLTLKLLGDDSTSTLNPMYEAMLNRPYIDLVQEAFGEFGWTTEMPRDPPTHTTLTSDFTFVGHKCVAATVPTRTGIRTYMLPALPFPVVLSINEYYKLSKDRDVPEAVRFLGRYYASWERAFPYLFSKDPVEQAYVRHAYTWLQRQKARYRDHPNEAIRKTVSGMPTLRDLVNLYFPFCVDTVEIERALIPLLLAPAQG